MAACAACRAAICRRPCATLLIERERGELPDFKRIVIETSGLADPSPILQTFSTDRALGEAFYLELVVTVADAATGVATLEWSSEARKQAILADRIIISKGDIASAEPLRARLRALNANAEIIEAENGATDPKAFTEPGDGARNVFVAEAEHSDGISSFVLTQDQPMPWQVWLRTMDTLMAMRGSDLLRVKGLSRRRGLHRAGRRAVRAAPGASAGRAANVAGRQQAKPRRVHHARGERSSRCAICSPR